MSIFHLFTIITNMVVDEYIAGAVRVYQHCHEYGMERELSQNLDFVGGNYPRRFKPKN
jgi:hypothetical protein